MMMPFIDIQAQRRRLKSRIDDAIQRVLAHGQFIMGPEVAALETELAKYCRVGHAITCSSGTDALLLALTGLGVGRGDAVFCPTFTFCATAEAAFALGATPVLADVEADSFNVSARTLAAAIPAAVRHGLRPAGIIAVDLFGLPADYEELGDFAERHGLWILADAAQSFGGRRGGKPVGALAPVTATSFFPSKPLGCYGDGGAIFTDDDSLASDIRVRRVHGLSDDRDNSLVIGMTGRLDTLQAAILLEKLAVLEDELESRAAIAARYGEALADVCGVPAVPPGYRSAWAQYTIRVPGQARDGLARHLRNRGIPTAVYYRRPLHRQTAYLDCPVGEGGTPVADRLAGEVLSLPMHPYLSCEDQDAITGAVRAFLTEARESQAGQ